MKGQFVQSLGQRIRNVRLEKQMTVEELAFKAGLSYSQVDRIELGKINTSAYTLFKLVEALEVCPSRLLIVPPVKQPAKST